MKYILKLKTQYCNTIDPSSLNSKSFLQVKFFLKFKFLSIILYVYIVHLVELTLFWKKKSF